MTTTGFLLVQERGPALALRGGPAATRADTLPVALTTARRQRHVDGVGVDDDAFVVDVRRVAASGPLSASVPFVTW